MGSQIAVRLPDDMIDFIDSVVANGDHASRAEAVRSAIEQMWRRRLAESDIAILKQDSASDLDDAAAQFASTGLDI